MDDKEHTYFNDFPKMPRLTILPWLIWALVIVAIITGGIRLSYAAAPDLIARYGALTVYLHDKPCTNAIVLAMLEPRVHKTYRAGKAVHSVMGEREFCYLKLSQYPNIFLLDEAGEQAELAKTDFHEEPPELKGRKGEVSI